MFREKEKQEGMGLGIIPNHALWTWNSYWAGPAAQPREGKEGTSKAPPPSAPPERRGGNLRGRLHLKWAGPCTGSLTYRSHAHSLSRLLLLPPDGPEQRTDGARAGDDSGRSAAPVARPVVWEDAPFYAAPRGGRVGCGECQSRAECWPWRRPATTRMGTATRRDTGGNGDRDGSAVVVRGCWGV